MSYSFSWDITAIETYIEEIEFILYKWNYREVANFKTLVDLNLKRLCENTEIGRLDKQLNVSYLVISKQTTLYYSVDNENFKIRLHVFWNNLKNPNDLKKLL
ncbi:hypothetical protein [Flavobacterium tegetincola]|uniref:hypothetical protein n=1 Tax=Flavobacterium tegetincola TaxID=150172 RepID=UPI0005519A12|nr:hypothetical protein [Flavobacterium tegetincola]